jgi:formylglycine-generating enzyme required for sulfatase activity
MTFVWIPKGKFVLGAAPEVFERLWSVFAWPEGQKSTAISQEGPPHEVQMEGFWIAQNEVTVRQYLEFCKANKYEPPATLGPSPALDEPITNVSWEDAQAYCRWAHERLPTEAEWERAARGPEGTDAHTFVWGDGAPGSPRPGNLPDMAYGRASADVPYFANYDDGFARLAPVRKFQPNGFKLYDMAGNVWEWCQDWFDPAYLATSPFPAANPAGPALETGEHVFRGGAYNSSPSHLRITARLGAERDRKTDNLGFRPVWRD